VTVCFATAEDRTEEAPRPDVQWGSSSAEWLTCAPELAGVLHDLQQPLAAIRALASAPMSDGGSRDGADDLNQRLRQIGELGEWMNELLRTGSANLSAVDGLPGADASHVVRDVLLAAAASFGGTLRWRPSGPAPVALDPLALRRAFGNVVDNATRAAGPEGWVRVRIRRARSGVWIDVEDNGPGFGRLRPQTQRGLAVTQAVLARCGGLLEIGSGRSGGALVRMKLPPAVADLSA
jgi:C4-dicarboxylate-specific signal transduction histidine kinase